MENINQIPNLQPVLNPEPVKNSNIFNYLFIVSIIVLLGTIVCFYLILNNKIAKLSEEKSTETTLIQTQTTTNNELIPTIKKVNIDPTQFLNQLQATLKTSSPVSASDNSWIDQNNQYIPLIGQRFGLAGTVSNDYVSKYGNYSNLESITINSFKNLQSDIDDFFKLNNFEKDKTNTINHITNNLDTIDTIVVGYTKDETKCLITLSAKTDPFANFFCGIIDEKRASWVKELSPIFNPNKDLGIIVTVNKMVGNYAQGGNGGRWGGGGAAWIALKTDGVWKKIWGGQDTISCSVVSQYQIPKEIYGDCQ